MNKDSWLKNVLSDIRKKSEWRSKWIRQHSKKRFEYRSLHEEFQVYGSGLLNVCICSTEENAEMICNALNFYL